MRAASGRVAVGLVTVALALLAAGSCLAQRGYYGKAPLPQPGGWVNDFAGAFDQANRQKLLDLCVDLEAKTTAELTVVTIDSLQGESAESYAARLIDTWGVGKRGVNNGVVLLFAMQDRRMWLQPADGIRSALPQPFCQQVINTIRPFFKAGRYGDGAYAGASQIAAAVAQYYGQALRTAPTPRPPRVNPFTALRDKLSRWAGRYILWIVLLPYILLRMAFARVFGGRWSDSGGWTSGWGGSGGGGFGGFGGGGGGGGGGGAGGSW